MVGLSSLFDIAKSALATTQQALTVVGHNVANVGTPGYARQEAVLVERPPLNGLPGMVGGGVQATAVRRIVDRFVEDQLTASHETLGSLTVAREELFRLQHMFGDGNNQGVGARLTEFFRSLQDVAAVPSEVTPRAVLLAKAGLLTGGLNQVADEAAAQQLTLNDRIKQTITEINSLTKRIAELNNDIATAEAGGQNANDLRDQRQTALNDLADRIDISTIETGTGAVSVFAARGQVLVEEHLTRNVVAVASLDKDGLIDVQYDLGGTVSVSISSLISGGRLKGLLDVRDVTIPGLLASFDQLAATLTNEVNQLHRSGYGLDGSTDLDFFTPIAVTARARAANQGSAAIGSGAVSADGLLTFHDYEIRFSSSTAYSIVDTTTGASIRGNYTGTAITPPTADAPIAIVTGSNDTVTVTVDGTASGTITLTGAVSPGSAYNSGAALASELQAKINADAALSAAGKSVTVTFDSVSKRFIVASTAKTAASAVNVTGGSARASLGLASGTSTAASGTYAGPQTFNLDGIAVTLSGTAATNDVFTVNSYAGAAEAIAVSLTDGGKVAASSTLAGVPGNNETIMALSALQSKLITGLGGATFNDAYRTAAAGIGVAAQTADSELTSQTLLHEQIETFRAQTSGVSIDEELAAMMQYQRAFEAAAKMIVMADELLDALMSLKR